MGKGPYLLSQNVMEKSRLCWRGGPNNNNFFNKPNICYNTAVMCGNNVITCSRKQANVALKYDSDSGKHAFKGINKVCNNIDFSNNSNYDGSSCSANKLHGPSGQHVDGNVHLIKNTLVVNYVASPFHINDIEDCCINDTKLHESHIWPLCGEVVNCIVHFTNTYGSNTCGTGTGKGLVLMESKHVFW